VVDIDISGDFAPLVVAFGLGSLQRAEAPGLRAASVAQVEVAHPTRLAFEHELCGPRFGFAFFLRPRETVDVSSVLGNIDEKPKIGGDESRLVIGPDGEILAL